MLEKYYEDFINLCCPDDLYNKCIYFAKKKKSRLNLLLFDINDKFENDIPYCAIVQGTHKTNNESALLNKYVVAYKNSDLPPVIDEIKKRLQIDLMGYNLNIYKFWFKKWAIELEWYEDQEHNKKILDYSRKYGSPF